MKQYFDYTDERSHRCCAFCEEAPDTIDHIPARTFLIKPYPENLHTISTCSKCNNVSSKDEESVAFTLRYLKLLEDGKMGELENYLDSARRLRNEDKLFDMLSIDDKGNPFIGVDAEAVKRILVKYAKAHTLYEMGERMIGMPTHVAFVFKNQIGTELLAQFEAVQQSPVYPEVASRLLQRIVQQGENSWLIVQDNQYRYSISYDPIISVKIVISETLLGEISWAEEGDE